MNLYQLIEFHEESLKKLKALCQEPVSRRDVMGLKDALALLGEEKGSINLELSVWTGESYDEPKFEWSIYNTGSKKNVKGRTLAEALAKYQETSQPETNQTTEQVLQELCGDTHPEVAF